MYTISMQLKDRGYDMMGEMNSALLERIITAVNELTDDEFVDVLKGVRGGFSLGGGSTFKLCDDHCSLGAVENVHCAWLDPGERCRGKYCKHISTKRRAKNG